jgi:hypothetical protein
MPAVTRRANASGIPRPSSLDFDDDFVSARGQPGAHRNQPTRHPARPMTHEAQRVTDERGHRPRHFVTVDVDRARELVVDDDAQGDVNGFGLRGHDVADQAQYISESGRRAAKGNGSGGQRVLCVLIHVAMSSTTSCAR